MRRIIVGSVAAFMVVLICMAYFGTVNSRDIKWHQMPDGLIYEVYIAGNTWPDRCYASTYEAIDTNTINFPEGYWVFEPSKKLFGSSSWVFHQAETKGDENHRYTVTRITTTVKE
ncbi:MAG: hypothetical protein FWF98_04320 [Dehalococcoidia bacterium]|nr:hypothetical protein [Dehalococcoidia bacterium]